MDPRTLRNKRHLSGQRTSSLQLHVLHTQSPPDSACNSRIIGAILSYRVDALWEVQRWEQNYAKLSARHKVWSLYQVNAILGYCYATPGHGVQPARRLETTLF